MSAYVSSRHCEAQSKYAHRHGGQRCNVSATGSDGDRGGRGRGGRSGQRGDRNAGRGRGRGSGGRMRSYINEVDVTDPHRNFTAAKWEKLGTMRSVILRMREGNGNGSGGCGGRGGNESRSPTNRTTSGVSAADNSNNNGNAEASVISEIIITERGSQNRRSFGRGAYSNNN
jgi:hypothetical protein